MRPALTAVPGVAEIASFGGFEKQYQVEVDPAKLLAFDIPLGRRSPTLCAPRTRMSADACWRWAATEYVVRGRGRFQSLDDIRRVSFGVGPGGTPVTVGDVANVQIGPEIRRGIADLDGRGEIVTGWVVMRYGENPLAVIQRREGEDGGDPERRCPKASSSSTATIVPG